MKTAKIVKKKEIEDEINIIFSCNRFDNIGSKACNIKLEIENKVEKN